MSLLAAIGVGSAILGGIGKRRAGKEQSKLARQQELMAQENAMLERRELTEGLRRQEIKNEQVSGGAMSRAAASGVTISGSTENYLNYIDTEQATQLDWMADAGASRIEQNLQANLLQAKSTKLSAKSMKLGAVTDLLGAFGMAGQTGLLAGKKSSYNAGSFYSDVNIPLTAKEKGGLFK